MNNSLASLRHQRGRNSTDPLPVNACTNSCANSALLYCFGRNYRSVLRAGIVTVVLRRQRSSNKEHLNVTTKSEREEGVRVGNRDAKSSNSFFYRIVLSKVYLKHLFSGVSKKCFPFKMDKEIKEKKRRNAVNIKKNRFIPEHSLPCGHRS